MTWLNPWGWWWLAAALPVIALYILRIRRRRVEAPTTLFWEEVFQDSKPRAWWRELRHVASLLLQLLFLLLVVLALTDPLTAGQTQDRRLWVFAVDRSASMSMPADPGDPAGPTRLDQARAEALRWTRRIRDWDEAMVVAVAGETDVRCGRTRDLGAVRRAIRTIEPSDLPGDPSDARHFIESIRAEDREPSVVVFTDGQGEAFMEGGTRWVVVGRPVPNLGITAFAARPVGESQDRQRIWLRVLNASPDERQVAATLWADGQVIDSVFFGVGAGQQQAQTVEHLLPNGGLLEARLEIDGDDGLAADNRAWLVIPPPGRTRVALIAPEPNLFVEQVLAAQPMVDAFRWPVERAAAIGPDDADVVVLHRVVPDPLPPVPSLFLEPMQDSALWSLREPITNSVVTTMIDDDPRLRHVNLDQTLIRQAVPLAPEGGEILVESFGEPLCVAWRSDGRRSAALAIGLERSDLPLRTAFPIWMANLIRWAAGTSEEPTLAYATGDAAQLDAGAAAFVRLEQPDESVVRVPARDGTATVGPFEQVGLHRVADEDNRVPAETIAVNLTDAAESDGLTGHAGITAEAGVTPAGWSGGRPLWMVFVFIALLWTAAEWGLYHRRVIE